MGREDGLLVGPIEVGGVGFVGWDLFQVLAGSGPETDPGAAVVVVDPRVADRDEDVAVGVTQRDVQVTDEAALGLGEGAVDVADRAPLGVLDGGVLEVGDGPEGSGLACRGLARGRHGHASDLGAGPGRRFPGARLVAGPAGTDDASRVP